MQNFRIKNFSPILWEKQGLWLRASEQISGGNLFRRQELVKSEVAAARRIRVPSPALPCWQTPRYRWRGSCEKNVACGLHQFLPIEASVDPCPGDIRRLRLLLRSRIRGGGGGSPSRFPPPPLASRKTGHFSLTKSTFSGTITRLQNNDLVNLGASHFSLPVRIACQPDRSEKGISC